MPLHPRRRAFTILEGLAFILVLFIIFAIILVLQPRATRKTGTRSLRDSSYLRGIHQSMVTWAGSNKDRFPLPSELDRLNTTVPELSRAKDTTANILSILIWNGSITPELCVSPAEASGRISVHETYVNANPTKAIDPANAQWDPSFSADFVNSTGNVSYAHLQPSGTYKPAEDPSKSTSTGRLDQWRDTLMADRAIIANRAPEITSVDPSRDPASPTVQFAIQNSVTLNILGSKNTWAGNIAFNDNHVEFSTGLAHAKPAPTFRRYASPSSPPRGDIIFFDEPDDPSQSNDFLAIFTKAGPTPADFKAIWD